MHINLIIFSFFASLVFAPAKTIEQSVIHNLRNTIELYKNEFKKVPTNWESFDKDGYRNVLKDANKIMDLENRYYFPKIAKTFNSDTNTAKKIILMAKRPGGEGDIKLYNQDGSFYLEPGRIVFFEELSGGINSGRILESALHAMFEEAGLNLSDYTLDSPAIPKRETKPYRLPDSLRPSTDPEDILEKIGTRAEKKRQHDNDGTTESRPTITPNLWWAIAIGVVGCCGLWVVIRRLKA